MLGTSDTLRETMQRFREDLPLYAAACLKIRDKSANVDYLSFNFAQKLVHERFEKQKKERGRVRAIVLKARQEGVSTYTAARFFRDIHLWPGTVAMVVADITDRTDKLYSIYDRFYQNLPAELMPIRKSIRRGETMAFSHDSELGVRPASDAQSGRAQTIHRLHASELAFWGDKASETWNSLMQAVPKQGSEVIIESTAKGSGGLFHELWEQAEEEYDRGGVWMPIFLPWWVHEEYRVEPWPEITEIILDSPDEFEAQAIKEGIPFEGKIHTLGMDRLAWRRMVIAETYGGSLEHPSKDAVRAFQQEYPATAEEAFLVSGACFFDEDVLRKYTRTTTDPETRGRLYLNKEGVVQLDPNTRGFVRLWELPEKERHYVVGADTAEGKLVATRRKSEIEESARGGRDYSIAAVVRLPYQDDSGGLQPPKLVAELHGHLAPEVFTEQLRLLGQMYSCGDPEKGSYRRKALIGVERNHSSGQTVLRLLKDHYKYVPLYWQREFNRQTKRIGKRVGWITDAVTRMPMLDELAEFVRKEQLEVPSKETVREMVTFVLQDNGLPAGEENCHDDRVIALGIAIQMLREHRHGYSGRMKEWEPDPDSQAG